ncbi:MAG: TrpB-like pyridoxal phosphate-dependent enzyme [Chloroflexi bacterium]|nr:TrpB-like pyridoxal phosphate-dependent enzyme [Chloroflexota bacterium]MDK1044765.1 TrpB-like pyridoxal phosphate-dependent enzyme [Anaerolineales bacterium]MCH8341935.1 TrpB-like pyridoxal phosphate-dependent enzyme [Chloroflexota bacterium]MCH8876277.1 TrpB-like pyridoxal phosphate-dependent enzyme [Chloroflexota bacterium]MCI0773452.1 TrpB-like pyridoxal phosphate-dependent enzyme [Chloroflexota bacterium]
MAKQYKYQLTEKDIPKTWYNIQADLGFDLPPLLHPETKEPTILPPPLFCEAINEQEFSKEREIEIPDPVREIYSSWRPTPLIRAHRLEKALDTPAHLYYKYEGGNPAGSHKPNTAVAQAFYAKEAGVKRLSTETGAGQWGSALAFACGLMDMECKVFMVRASYNQKPYRRVLMETWNAEVVPSPNAETPMGQAFLEQDADHPGSLGIAISEAVFTAGTNDDTNYSLGSVLNHVLMHQTVVGLEALKQFEMADEYPDILVGCIGGGSNFSGFVLPFVREKIVDGKDTRVIAVEPTASPSLTKGLFAFDYGDTAQAAPILKMYTLGHTFIPAPIHAGGLRYHGMAPIVSALHDRGIIEAVAVSQLPVFEAAVQFARAEGIIPAPESAHAVRVAIDEALRAKEEGTAKVIAFNLSGHGHFDMAAYDAYNKGELEDYEYPAEEVEKAVQLLPEVELA